MDSRIFDEKRAEVSPPAGGEAWRDGLACLEETMRRSCQRCAPGREGIRQMLLLLRSFGTREPTGEELRLLRRLGETVARTSRCKICGAPAARVAGAPAPERDRP